MLHKQCHILPISIAAGSFHSHIFHTLFSFFYIDIKAIIDFRETLPFGFNDEKSAYSLSAFSNSCVPYLSYYLKSLCFTFCIYLYLKSTLGKLAFHDAETEIAKHSGLDNEISPTNDFRSCCEMRAKLFSHHILYLAHQLPLIPPCPCSVLMKQLFL